MNVRTWPAPALPGRAAARKASSRCESELTSVVTADARPARAARVRAASSLASAASRATPTCERLLGEGSFGRVYLARDEQLQRFVAVKVPHRHLVNCPADADAYLSRRHRGRGWRA